MLLATHQTGLVDVELNWDDLKTNLEADRLWLSSLLDWIYGGRDVVV